MSDMFEQEFEAVKQDIRRLDDKVADVEAEAGASVGHVNDLLNWVRRFRILDWLSVGGGIESQDNVDGTAVIDGSVEAPYPFEVIEDYTYPASSTERRVSVRDGLFDVIKSGVGSVSSIALGTGISTSVTQISTDILASGSPVYVYLLVGKVSEDGNMIEATQVQAKISATRLDETDITHGQPHCVRILATVTNNAGVLDIIPEWFGGDIKEQPIVPDTTDLFNGADTETSKSITYDGFGRLGLYGFHGGVGQDDGKVLYAGNDGNGDMTLKYDYACLADSDENTSLTNIPVEFFPDGSQYIAYDAYQYVVGDTRPDGLSDFKELSPSQTINIWDYCDAWYTADPPAPPVHNHSNHTFTVDDHDNEAIDRYIINSGDAGRNNCTGGMVIGDAQVTPKASISPAARTLYDDVESAVVLWGAQELRTGNNAKWHTIDVAKSDTVIASNSLWSNGGFGATNGIYATKGTGNQAGLFENGSRIAKLGGINGAGYFEWTGVNSVELSPSPTLAVQVTGVSLFGGDVLIDTGDVKISTSGDYYHLGKQGGTITNWFSGGLTTGTGIIEIDADDLKSTDKILVVR